MDDSLIKLLEEAGLTEKEARVYLALLQLGQGDVTEIARAAELKRSIIYVLLEGLIKRGYASDVPNKKPAVYQAIDPSVILNKLKITAKNFSEMLPIFRTLGNAGKKRPKIIYYETKEGILNVFNEINQAANAYFISSYKKIDNYFPGEIERWIQNHKRGIISIKGKHIVGNNPFDLAVGQRYQAEIGQQVRYLPEVEEFNMDFAIYKNKLAITSLEDEAFVIVIESEELIKSIKILFEIAWEKAKEILK
ncbi:MAG: helix-turn-helix domain-containing protein [Patescibacteria group bacterium]|nr:helix-turn-helix domain-containing protein [Patescibacteria group bacterium]